MIQKTSRSVMWKIISLDFMLQPGKSFFHRAVRKTLIINSQTKHIADVH